MDWPARKVLGHRVVIALKATQAVEIVEKAFAHYVQPDILSTDQGRLFEAGAFTDACGIRLSMDGRGSWRDNVFVERVRRIKNAEVYLKPSESVSHARRSIGNYIELYNP
ncbi:hypothetical protein [Paraburkholderia atlantica]|uniref:hypothetical protein n=1 Tax=Paraburkholderia atlantica TaxID=2654982 RepID=UPI0001BF32D3|nr:hypothetical protein [Paraburkholderia atlantica]